MTRSESGRAKWLSIVDEQRSSGLPVKQFCNRRSIPCSSFFAWRRKLAAGSSGPAPTFVEAAVGRGVGVGGDDGRGGGVMIELCGVRVLVNHGFDRRLLLDVIEALAGVSWSPKMSPF